MSKWALAAGMQAGAMRAGLGAIPEAEIVYAHDSASWARGGAVVKAAVVLWLETAPMRPVVETVVYVHEEEVHRRRGYESILN
jgi:hypothetical protein